MHLRGVTLVFTFALLARSEAAAICGNGVVEAGEACDDGAQNGSFNSCCQSDCALSGKTPDLVVGDMTETLRYGTSGGITAYTIATTACNIGSCWLNWFGGNAEHPVIGENMFRLKDGRFEQIGQAWLKHGFAAAADNDCAVCNPPPNMQHLGVHCSDAYDVGTNGQQTRLGPKVDVNPNTGVFLFPDPRINTSGDIIFKRLQVHNSDLDPAFNPGAVYFVEAQYVTHDDAKSNGNNASYRPVGVGAAPDFFLTFTGSTQLGKAGIVAWKTADPAVTQTTLKGADGTFILAAKATPLPNGLYHYEYAVQNLTNNRAAQSFTVPIPAGATISKIDFHDVDYHSGEPFDGTSWTPAVSSTSVSWATQTFDVNVNANALRWGTLYNFRFDANVAPGVSAVTIGLFKPGSPATMSAMTVTPNACGALPSEVDDGVRLAHDEGVTTITWTEAPGSVTSSVLRGLVGQLPVGPGGGDELCLETDIAGTSTTDAEEPAPGEAFWYLVRGDNDCGDGPYGVASEGGVLAPRQSATCP